MGSIRTPSLLVQFAIDQLHYTAVAFCEVHMLVIYECTCEDSVTGATCERR